MSPRDSYYPLVLIFVGLDGITVALRLWIRYLKCAIGYDDLALAVSLVGFCIFGGFELAAISYGIGSTQMKPGFDPVKAGMYFTIAQIVYILTTGISKLAIALVLYRLVQGTGNKVLNAILQVSMVVIGTVTLAVALIFVLQCRPLSIAWGVGKGTCVSTAVIGNAGIVISAVDVAVSWLYGLLPVWILHKTQIPPRLKAVVLFLLGISAISSVATVIRLKMTSEVARLTQTTKSLASEDLVQLALEATIYSIIKAGLSILAATLSALRPFVKHLTCFRGIGSFGNGGPDGKPDALALKPLRTFGQGQSRGRGRSYSINDEGSRTSILNHQKFIVVIV